MSNLPTKNQPTVAPASEAAAQGRVRALWPPTRPQAIGLMLAVIFLAGAVGFVVGSRQSAPPGRDSVDVGFLYDMISHHEQAITISNLELENGGENAVKVFAREILALQSYEIGLMEQQLAEWGYSRDDPPGPAMGWMHMPADPGMMPGMASEPGGMPGMASEDELNRLATARGRDSDALFLSLMQDHHRGGVHMAEYAADNAETEFVRTLAARMARNQRVEIAELDQARGRTGLPADPPGYQPAAIPG